MNRLCNSCGTEFLCNGECKSETRILIIHYCRCYNCYKKAVKINKWETIQEEYKEMKKCKCPRLKPTKAKTFVFR